MELLDKGKHCQDEFCHQLDLLPMKCKACSMYFCSEHFKYENHSCKESYKLNYQIPTCELCKQTIEFKRGQNLDECLARHLEMCDLNSSKKNKSNKQKKCTFKNCKSKEIFRFECESCLMTYCNKHRLPEDHKCDDIKQTSHSHAQSCSSQYRNAQSGVFYKAIQNRWF